MNGTLARHFADSRREARGKGLLFVLFMMWVRWTLPRLRVDQLMGMSWKLLIPAGFISIAVMAAVILAGWA